MAAPNENGAVSEEKTEDSKTAISGQENDDVNAGNNAQEREQRDDKVQNDAKHSSHENDEKIGGQLLEMLDILEKRVKDMRTKATEVKHEKECLLMLLNSIQESEDLAGIKGGIKEDVKATVDRLTCRCLTVDVTIHIPRTEDQLTAARDANIWVDTLVKKIARSKSASTTFSAELQEEQAAVKKEVQACLNACSSQEPSGAVDTKFQNILMACTVEDQKRIKSRLESILRETSLRK